MGQDMTLNRLLKLLRNLDALAANPGTPAEGESARAKALYLRERHKDLLVTKRAQIQEMVSTFAIPSLNSSFVFFNQVRHEPRRTGPHTGSGI